MDTAEQLKNNSISAPIKKFTAELSEIYFRNSADNFLNLANENPLLNRQTAELGLVFLNKLPGLSKPENQWFAVQTVEIGDERYQRIKEIVVKCGGWQSAEIKNLLTYFFGSEKAEYVSHALARMPFEMYQNGYLRRSFRAPQNAELYFINQINFLINAIPQTFTFGNYPSYERAFYDLSVAEQIRYSTFFQQNSLFRLWSAAVDLGNKKVFRQLEDIIFNKDEIGKVSRDIIKTLLNSEKREAWELVEKLLLAAQRQEGLRQTILEALDETSIGALKFMLGVIVKNNLARFSSVVRAVDVWAGLGWESEREKTVKTFLEKAHDFLENPAKIPEAMKSANNADVYMALWAQGVFDVEQTAPFLEELCKKGNAEKRALALKFAIETKHYDMIFPLFYKTLDDADLLVSAWTLHGINSTFADCSPVHNKDYYAKFPEFFEKLHAVVQRSSVKKKSFEGAVFSWTRIEFNVNSALSAMIELIGNNNARLEVLLSYFGEMSVDLRQKMTQHILGDYAGWSWSEKKSQPKPTKFQHDFAVRILSDKGEFMVTAAFRVLGQADFSHDEMSVLQNLLKRKGANFRGKIIALLLNQTDRKLLETTVGLLTNGDAEQRLAGLDILLQLKKAARLTAETQKMTVDFRARKNISPKEEILLEQLSDSEKNEKDFSAANGFGLFNAQKSVSPIIAPQINPENIYEKRLKANECGFSKPVAEIKKALENLAEIYLQNKDFEYEIENWDGSKQKVLLGNTFRRCKNQDVFGSKREDFEDYPLWGIWEKWFANSGLDAADLEIISLSAKPKAKNQIPSYEELLPKEFKKFYVHNNPLHGIVNALKIVFPFAEKDEFMLGGCARMFTSLDEKTLKAKPSEKYYYLGNHGNGWQSDAIYHSFYNEIDSTEIENRFIEQYWKLAHWRQFSGREENIPFSFPTLMIFCRAFELGIIGKDEMLRGLMIFAHLKILSAKNVRNEFKYFERFPFLREMFENVREHLLDIELKRGDSPTSATILAAGLETIYGAKRFVEILAGLGKTALYRGYFYQWSREELNKQESFSRLLKNCFPAESNTQKEFESLVKGAKISEKKLIEVAVYAPQWQKFISKYLNWNGLDSAIWWMHAHTKISGYHEQNSEAESEIARYSAVDLQDFKDGAVDKDWFFLALKSIGKARWETIYEAAKYISDGNGHRRARLYSDVLSGKTKFKEISQKVKEKRDQDYLRMFGLAPLDKKNPEKDVLSRYEYLQKFKKESRQFGAQKQASETLAARIALENLARNANYADPQRLTWAMETKQVQKILSSETEIRHGDFLVKLLIDEEGKAEVVTLKNEKELKSIPPVLKKDAKIAELREHKKTLKEQFSRSRIGLEEAMVRGDSFSLAELQTLFSHPIISKHLEKLVFITGKNHGFYADGKLVSAKNIEFAISETDEIRIAHCVDLFDSGEWSDYQRFCFERQIKQPFKQIFRELYTLTEDEKNEKSISRRYAGHQIQPRKTAALLKTRGWKADYEEGLQKVFHKEGFTAKMYALADWFSPAEVENPTLENIEFHSLKDYKNVAFEEINPRIFSEVMRDIDLVVSVAHAGGVDAEASHSTIEMRKVLLGEIVRLYKLENVKLNETHVCIKGKLGEYSVHLGSATVHRVAGKYLSILPVQSQQRGRIFLPFADDDPKSAEVMSKVLLLARDGEIQDPTILRQIT